MCVCANSQAKKLSIRIKTSGELYRVRTQLPRHIKWVTVVTIYGVAISACLYLSVQTFGSPVYKAEIVHSTSYTNDYTCCQL